MKTLLLLAVMAISCPVIRVSAEPAIPPSTLVTDVLKMARAKVGEDVILAFVQSSPGKTPVSASEILELHNLGVSSRVQIALLNHGQLGSEPAPPPAEPAASKASGPPEDAGQVTLVSDPPEPVVVAPTTDYVAVASPVYVGGAYCAPYYPCYDGWYGFGWGFGWALGWWGWNSCYHYGYPYYGYGYHCGYYYPGCGNGHGNGYYVNNSSAGKSGVAAIGGSGYGSAQNTSGIIRPGPVAGVAGGNTKGVQPGGKPGIAPSSSVLGGNATSQATSPIKPTGNQLVSHSGSSMPGTKPGVGGQSTKPTAASIGGQVTKPTPPGIGGQSIKPTAPSIAGQSVKPAAQIGQNSSKPTFGSPVGNWPGSGAQAIKPTGTSLGTARAGQSVASTAKPVSPGIGTRVAQPAGPGVGASVASTSRSGAMPARNSAVYAGSGAKGFSNPGSFAGRPSAGYSGVSRGGYSGSSVASLGYSGGGSRGAYSGFSGSRGGYSGFSGGGGGRSGGFSGGRGGGFSGGYGGRR